jgi:hypothetical protein
MEAAKPQPPDPQQGLASLPCSVCGQPTTGWIYYSTTDDDGNDVVEGFSACAAHLPQNVESEAS